MVEQEISICHLKM